MRRAALTALLILSIADAGSACPVCATRGREKTIVDHIVGSHQVVIGRRDESDARGERYTISSVFAGERPEHAVVDPEDSPALEKRFQKNEEAFVFIRERASRPWQRYCGESYIDRALLLEVSNARPEWTGPDQADRRARFFIPSLKPIRAESSSRMRIALEEVSRGSYPVLREAARVVSRHALREFVVDPKWSEQRAVLLVLLSINAEPEDKLLLEALYEEALRAPEPRDLSAIASARIELHGTPAIEELETAFLKPAPKSTSSRPASSSTSKPRTHARSRRPEDIEAVAAALSVHGALEAGVVRDAVLRAYSRVLEVAPSLAALVAKDAFEWGHFDLVPRVREIYQTRGEAWSFAERTAIRRYIGAPGIGF